MDYKIRGRYGNIHTLEGTDKDNVFRLVPMKEWMYIRYIGNDTHFPEAVDTDGGPMLSVGYHCLTTDGTVLLIKKIEWIDGKGCFITTSRSETLQEKAD